MAWDPAQYHKFRDERAAPFEDLIALLLEAAGSPAPGRGAGDGGRLAGLGLETIVDLGCGTGELTARLAAMAPGARVVGLDSSTSMLAKARALEGARPRGDLRFVEGAIETWSPERPVSLLFSHAALQWVDGHEALFRRLASLVAPGGHLLVQMPSNHGHPSHQIVRGLAAEPPWPARLGGYNREFPVLPIDAYAELLHAAGLERPTVLERVYGHQLAGSRGVLDWIRGTLLVPYLERLTPERAEEFLGELATRFVPAMPGNPYYYAFRRTLIAARRPPDR